MNKTKCSANSLNLHGIKHIDAKQVIITFIESNWDMDKELTIITGNSIIMKGMVINILNEYKLSFRVSQTCYGKIVTWT